jgi:hypothetical protein
MMQPISKYIYLVYAIVTGVVFGSFAGLFIIGTIIRIILDALFGYGDRGPLWVSVVIIIETIVVVVFVTKLSIGWMRDYHNKKITKVGRPG